jgi:hypothetical protein
MRRALPTERREHLQDGTAPQLVDIRRQFTAWAASVVELPDPDMPANLFNRAGDNWRVLLAIADVAGGPWPQMLRQAAEEALTLERRPPITVRLLTSIRKAFATDRFLRTQDLIAKLLADEEEDWGTVNRGRPVSPAWLREALANLLDPPGSQQSNYVDASGIRRNQRGYTLNQFTDAFRRYLPEEPAPASSEADETAAPCPEPEIEEALHTFSPSGPAHSSTSTASTTSPASGDATQGPECGNGEALEADEVVEADESNEDRGKKTWPNGAGNGAHAVSSTSHRSRQVSRLTQAIRALAAAHPDWSPTRIAREAGQPEATVRQALQNWTPPPPASPEAPAA